MKKWLTLLALGLPFAAAADNTTPNGFYVGGGAVAIELNTPKEYKDDWVAVEGFAGYKHSPFVGGEVRVGAGSGDADLIYSSLYYRTESANDVAKMYLLFGYSVGQLTYDEVAEGESDTKDLYGFSYGVGVSFLLSNKFNVNLEYRMILDGDLDEKYEGKTYTSSTELTGYSISVDYRF